MQRRFQPLAAHGLGEVVGRVQLEGLQRVLGVRRHEDERRRRGQGAELARQLHAAGAGHVNVDERRVKALMHQQIHGGRRAGGLGGHFGGGVAAIGQQAAQARARQWLVIDDEHLQGSVGSGHGVHGGHGFFLRAGWLARICATVMGTSSRA